MVHQRTEQDPGHSAIRGGNDRPFVKAANPCSTRTIRRREGRRPIQTASGPRLSHCRRSNATFARRRFELSGFSIASAQPSSNTDVEESMPRASDRHLTPAAQFPSNDVDSLGHLVAHRKNKTKIETNFAAILGKLDRKRDARNDALHVLRSDAQNSIVPNVSSLAHERSYLASVLPTGSYPNLCIKRSASRSDSLSAIQITSGSEMPSVSLSSVTNTSAPCLPTLAASTSTPGPWAYPCRIASSYSTRTKTCPDEPWRAKPASGS